MNMQHQNIMYNFQLVFKLTQTRTCTHIHVYYVLNKYIFFVIYEILAREINHTVICHIPNWKRKHIRVTCNFIC